MRYETTEEIYKLYEKGRDYHSRIGLDEKVAQNENFFIGRQWEGVNAPNLDKPVFNILKRSINFFISLLVSDDIGIAIRSEDPLQAKIAMAAVNSVIETGKLKSRFRDMLRDAAVDGDGCIYYSYNDKVASIEGACVDNTNVFFGNTAVQNIQAQPYVILRTLRKRDSLITQFANLPKEVLENIREDDKENDDDVVTVLHFFTKIDGNVYAACTTKTVMLQPLFNTTLKLYPIAFMNWDRVKNCYHGESVVSGLIPNQIFINKTFAMAMKTVKDMSFPKIVYDRTKIKAWTNEVGAAIPVNGSPTDAIATSIGAASIPSQVMALVDKTMAYTRDLMGATNAALGDVNPVNTSAIIAVQKASSLPLELQKQSYYQFIEDSVLSMLDMMRVYYGRREITYENDEGEEATGEMDFSTLTSPWVKIEVGASAYFSEIMQMQTLDNLYKNGVITDPLTYLGAIPGSYIQGKEKIIRKMKGAANGRELQ